MKKQLLSVIFASSILLSAFGQSTGFLSPTTTTAPNGWTNPANVFVSDNVWSTVAHQSGCRCPFIYLSWNGGVNYTSSQLAGPFGTVDGTAVVGGATNTWGHSWTVAELSNANFMFKIANPSTIIEQGYKNFNFVIPMGATITGIEVKVEEHGDSAFTMEYIDLLQVNVHYTTTIGIEEISSSKTEITVSPNPFTSSTIIKSNSDFNNATLTVYNSLGEEVKQLKNSSGTELKLERDNLPNGIYFIRCTQDNAILTTTKFIIID